jgi:purine-binding chemotaxis protein CheW
VQEIRSYQLPTRIAGAPAYIRGVINLRGVNVPIVDLRMKFDLERAEFDAFTVVVILNVGGRVVGAVVDSVSDAVQLGTEQIRPTPQFSGAVDASYILGIGSVGDVADRDGNSRSSERMLILIDIKRLMRGAEMGLFDG